MELGSLFHLHPLSALTVMLQGWSGRSSVRACVRPWRPVNGFFFLSLPQLQLRKAVSTPRGGWQSTEGRVFGGPGCVRCGSLACSISTSSERAEGAAWPPSEDCRLTVLLLSQRFHSTVCLSCGRGRSKYS